MKSKLTTLLHLSLLSVVLVISESGCSTTPAGKVVQAENVVVTTVDAAMEVWKIWVLAGNASQTQVDLVKKYYNDYYTAQLAVESALQKWVVSGAADDATLVATATQAATTSQIVLVSAITSLTTTKS